MNANRKADLQRKLTLVPTPKPPSGLAERIKSDIPKQLRFDAEKERQRLSRAVAFNLRVAAAVLVLISSSYLALQFMSRLEQGPAPAALDGLKRSRPAVKAVTQTAAPAAEPQAQATPPPAKVAQRRAKQQKKAPELVAAAPPPPPAAAPAALPVSAEAAARKEVKSPVAESITVSGVRDDQRKLDAQLTTSPVSGKNMLHVLGKTSGEIVGARQIAPTVWEVDRDSALERDFKMTPWKEMSPEAKQKILEAELARGADPKEIARRAREAGLIEFADSIEKKH
jgi:hypothetical protein